MFVRCCLFCLFLCLTCKQQQTLFITMRMTSQLTIRIRVTNYVVYVVVVVVVIVTVAAAAAAATFLIAFTCLFFFSFSKHIYIFTNIQTQKEL